VEKKVRPIPQRVLKQKTIEEQKLKLTMALNLIRPGEGISIERKSSTRTHLRWLKYEGSLEDYTKEVETEFYYTCKSLRKGQKLQIKIMK
jgi:hypothetical protein